MLPFYTLRKHQKTFGFLLFSGVIKWEHWPEIGYANIENFLVFYHFMGVWVIRGPAPGPHIRLSATSPHKSFNQLNPLLFKVQPLWRCAHYSQWFTRYLNHIDLLMLHVHVLKKLPYCLMCT